MWPTVCTLCIFPSNYMKWYFPPPPNVTSKTAICIQYDTALSKVISGDCCSVSPCTQALPRQVICCDAAVHLQISSDYLRESCMAILQVTYRYKGRVKVSYEYLIRSCHCFEKTSQFINTNSRFINTGTDL